MVPILLTENIEGAQKESMYFSISKTNGVWIFCCCLKLQNKYSLKVNIQISKLWQGAGMYDLTNILVLHSKIKPNLGVFE